MQINNSSFPYGQVGFQRSQDKLDLASQKVADSSKETLQQSNSADKKGLYGSPIQDGLLEAYSSEREAQANARVIEASDRTLGRFIDITV